VSNLSTKPYHIYVCHTNVTPYIAFDIIRGSRNHGRYWNVLTVDRGHHCTYCVKHNKLY